MSIDPFGARTRAVGAAAFAALVAGAPSRAQEPVQASTSAWAELFDGRTLSGWTRCGGAAEYAVVDGTIVGTTVAGQPNSFLCTTEDWADFELELEVRVDPSLNSGIQVRSQRRSARRSTVVFGYQVEVDPSARAWSGGIYDEGRRGWLDDLADEPAARAAFVRDGWNRYRVLCVGDSLRTWVNDVPAADLVDSTDLRGFIALQVHGVGRDAGKVGRQVQWRNLRLRPLGAHAWRPLWNGTDLAGFRALGGGEWRVEDGVLVGTSAAKQPRHGILLGDAELADFTVRVVYRAVTGNSGLYFRCEPVDGAVGVHGFQAEIDPDPSKHAGGLYETGGRAWVVRPTARDVGFRAGEWNTMTVSAHGPRIVVHLNGVRSAELRDDAGRRSGRIGLQLHGGEDMRIEVRSLELLERVDGGR